MRPATFPAPYGIVVSTGAEAEPSQGIDTALNDSIGASREEAV